MMVIVQSVQVYERVSPIFKLYFPFVLYLTMEYYKLIKE